MFSSHYSITIEDRTNKSNKSPVAGSITSSKTTTSSSAPDTSGNGRAVLGRLVAIGGMAVHFTDQIISHEISVVSLRTGAIEQQERLSFAYSVGKQIGGMVLSTAVGAVLGGGLPGALIGLASSVASTAMSYGQKAADIQMRHDLEDIGLRYINARAGGTVASFSGSRSRRQ